MLSNCLIRLQITMEEELLNPATVFAQLKVGNHCKNESAKEVSKQITHRIHESRPSQQQVTVLHVPLQIHAKRVTGKFIKFP